MFCVSGHCMHLIIQSENVHTQTSSSTGQGPDPDRALPPCPSLGQGRVSHPTAISIRNAATDQSGTSGRKKAWHIPEAIWIIPQRKVISKTILNPVLYGTANIMCRIEGSISRGMHMPCGPPCSLPGNSLELPKHVHPEEPSSMSSCSPSSGSVSHWRDCTHTSCLGWHLPNSHLSLVGEGAVAMTGSHCWHRAYPYPPVWRVLLIFPKVSPTHSQT